jgi:hypothetical protein
MPIRDMSREHRCGWLSNGLRRALVCLYRVARGVRPGAVAR